MKAHCHGRRIATLRRFIMGLVLCSPAAVQAENLCARGEVSNGPLKMTVVMAIADGRTQTLYASVTPSNPSEPYALEVLYRPTEAGLGPAERLDVQARVPLPTDGKPQPHQIEWRMGPDEWFNPGYWSTPDRWESAATTGIVRYNMAQSPPHPVRSEILAAVARGIRYEFRSLGMTGNTVGSGWVEYPAAAAIVDMYAEARARTVANLKPCGPPVYITPAPSSNP